MIKSKQLKLNKDLFWDVDFKTLDFDKHKEYIIGRVLNQGDLDDFNQLRDYYGLPMIKQVACRIKYLDEKSLNFYSLIFNLPKSRFLCFQTPLKQKQSVWLNR